MSPGFTESPNELGRRRQRDRQPGADRDDLRRDLIDRQDDASSRRLLLVLHAEQDAVVDGDELL
jgi:hypothetical protein